MSKQRDWVDYANLASNVAQNVQLHDVQKKLGTLTEAARQQERRELINSVRAREENDLRELVFRCTAIIADARKQLPDKALPVSALTRCIQRRFDSLNITTGSFKSWEDKERFLKLNGDLLEVVKEASQTLSPEQMLAAEQCAQYAVEKSDLLEVIRMQKARESWKTKEAQLQTLRGSQPSAKVPAWYTGLLGAFVASLLLTACCYSICESNGGSQAFTVLFGAVSIILLVMVVGLYPKELTQQSEVAQKIKHLEAECADGDSKLRLMQSQCGAVKLKRLDMAFGKGLSSEAYTRMLEERQAHVTKVLGEAYLSMPI